MGLVRPPPITGVRRPGDTWAKIKRGIAALRRIMGLVRPPPITGVRSPGDTWVKDQKRYCCSQTHHGLSSTATDHRSQEARRYLGRRSKKVLLVSYLL